MGLHGCCFAGAVDLELLAAVCDGRVDQRRYFREKSRSRSKLRGNNACLRGEMPVLPVRVLGEFAEVFLPDHCQVGRAVMLIMKFPFLVGMKKPEACSGLRALAEVNRQNNICGKS
jgi:hypothetical protein